MDGVGEQGGEISTLALTVLSFVLPLCVSGLLVTSLWSLCVSGHTCTHACVHTQPRCSLNLDFIKQMFLFVKTAVSRSTIGRVPRVVREGKEEEREG